jgi:hypothetical protein
VTIDEGMKMTTPSLQIVLGIVKHKRIRSISSILDEEVSPAYLMSSLTLISKTLI